MHVESRIVQLGIYCSSSTNKYLLFSYNRLFFITYIVNANRTHCNHLWWYVNQCLDKCVNKKGIVLDHASVKASNITLDFILMFSKYMYAHRICATSFWCSSKLCGKIMIWDKMEGFSWQLLFWYCQSCTCFINTFFKHKYLQQFQLFHHVLSQQQ